MHHDESLWSVSKSTGAQYSYITESLPSAGEVHARMEEAKVKGKSISLKIKRRKGNAPEPIKFLGHGPCDNVSRSVTLNRFTDSTVDLARECRALLRALNIPADQIRGIGISVSGLISLLASLRTVLQRIPSRIISNFQDHFTPKI